MEKLFPTMLDEFEHFNPEVFPSEWFDSQGALKFTFDENGESHSYDDVPAFSNQNHGRKRNFMWYNHGVPERKNGLAPFIYIEYSHSGISYVTSKDGKAAHSFNGMPSTIHHNLNQGTFKLLWHNDGQLHREGSLPAWLLFFEKGVQQKPGEIKSLKDKNIWKICGITHNANGRAIVDSPVSKNYSMVTLDEYVLYGFVLPQSVFEDIKTYQAKTSVPLYAAFLFVLGIIPEEYLDVFKQEQWKMPLTWLTRYWGLTDALLDQNLLRLSKTNPGYLYDKYYSATRLTNLIKVATFEEQESITNAKEYDNA